MPANRWAGSSRKELLSPQEGPLLMTFPKISLVTLLCTLSLLCAPSYSAESPSQLEIPNPAIFLSPDTISFAVIQAHPDDAGFKALLDSAWAGVRGVDTSSSNPFVKLVMRAIEGRHSNALMSFLPFQLVRADSMGSGGKPHPTLAITVAGWPGLQSLFFSGISADKSGKQYPTKDLEEATLILRKGWKDPTRSHVLTRVDGTFMSFPTVSRAEKSVNRFATKNTSNPGGYIGELYQSLDTNHATYGVLINKKGSMLKFLRWLNKHDVGAAEQAVGAERMAKVMKEVRSLTWEGDLVSDDEMKFLIKFQTTSKAARKDLTKVLKEVRTVLDQYGRAGEMQATGLDSDLILNFSMTGNRAMLKRYFKNNF